MAIGLELEAFEIVKYVILGAPHPIQDSSNFERPVLDAIQRHAVILVAEEYPNDTTSRVCVASKRLHLPYLQIDMFPHEWPAHGIDQEMKARERLPMGDDIRLSHADAVREDFWLEKIEATDVQGHVLVICGYLHVDFLARRVRERGNEILETSSFPPGLVDRKPTRVLSPSEMEKYVRRLTGE